MRSQKARWAENQTDFLARWLSGQTDTDALAIAYGEKKSADGHTKVVDTLRSILGSRLPEAQVKQLRNILAQKDTVSYQGSYYSLAEGQSLLRAAVAYCKWAAELLEQRPA